MAGEVNKIAREEARKLAQQFFAAKAKDDCCVQPLKFITETTAELPDGSVVNVLSRGLPGTYATGIKVSENTWIANVEEPLSVDVGSDTISPQWTLGQFPFQEIGQDVIYEEKTGKYWGPPWSLLPEPENPQARQGLCIIRSSDGKDLYFQKTTSIIGQITLDGNTLAPSFGNSNIALKISWGIIENIKFTSTGQQKRYFNPLDSSNNYSQDIIETLGYSKLTTGIYTLTIDELAAVGGMFHNTPFPPPTGSQTLLTGRRPLIGGFFQGFSIFSDYSFGTIHIATPSSGVLKRTSNGFQLVLIAPLSWDYSYQQYELVPLTIPLFVPDVPFNACGGCNCSKTLSGEDYNTIINGSTTETGFLILSMSLGSSFTPSYIQMARLDELTPIVSEVTTFLSAPVLFGCSIDGPDVVQFDGTVVKTCIGPPVVPLISCQRVNTDISHTTPLVLTEPLGDSGLDPAIYGIKLYETGLFNSLNTSIIIPTSEDGEYIIFFYGQTGGFSDLSHSLEMGPAFATSIGLTFGGGTHSIATVFGTVKTHDGPFLGTNVEGSLPSFGRVLPTRGGLLTHVENITDELGTFLFDKNSSKVNFLSNTSLLDQDGNVVPDPKFLDGQIGSAVSASITYTLEKFSVLQGTGVVQASTENLLKTSTRDGKLTKFPSYSPGIIFTFTTPLGGTGVSKNPAIYPPPPVTFQTSSVVYYNNSFYIATNNTSGSTFNPNHGRLNSFPHRNNSVLSSGVLLT